MDSMSTWLDNAHAFESLFSASPSAILALDREFHVIGCNPACTLLSGYTKAEVTGKDVRTLAHTSLLLFIEDAFEAAAVEKSLQREVAITRKNGDTVLTEATSVPVMDASSTVYLFVVLHDASWRQEAEQRFRSLFDRNPIPAALYDADGFFVEVNAAALEQSGFPREYFVGQQLGHHCKPECVPAVRAAFERALGGQIGRASTELQAAGGEWIDFEVTFIPRNEGGRVAGAYGLYENVTRAKALASIEREFRTLFEHLPTPVIGFNRRQEIIDVNPAALALSGVESREQIVGRKLGEFLLQESTASAADAFDRAIHGTVTRNRAFATGADGRRLVFDVTNVPIYSGDEIVGVYALVENVTAQARTSEELAQMRLRFQQLFEHNPTVVVAVDTEQRVVDMNPAGVRLSGYDLTDICGRNITEFVPPSQRDRLRSFVAQAIKGETVSFPIDAYAADGRLIQYEATALPILEEHKIVGAYGLLENVTERNRAERTVAAQREEILDLEHDFQSLFAHNPDGICLLSTDGVVLDLNDAVVNMSRRSRELILGQNFRVFLQGNDLERGWAFFRRAVEGETIHYEITSARGDGAPLHLETTNFPKFAQGLVVGVYSVFKDITERKTSHRKIELQAQRMRDLYLLATTPEYSDAHVMSTLQTGCRLLGMESGAIIDSTEKVRVDMRYDSLELFAGDDERVLALAKKVLAHREPVAVHVGDPALGQGYGTWIGSRLMVGGNVHGVLLFFSRTQRDQPFEEVDLDTIALMSALVGSALERRRNRSHLRTLAYYDSLTGLPNRLFFQERLRDEILDEQGRVRPVAVLFFDLDRFKDINDTLGHAMGDRFLQMVAHRLVRAVGDSGLVARMGGDEFIVLLRDVQERGQVQELADALQRDIEEPFRLDGYEQFITTSIGLAVAPEDGRDDQTLIKHADIAMYRMKAQGGNGYLFFDQNFEAPLRTRLTQEKLLRRALERDQFVVHYQPIVDCANDRIVSVEALVRWMDPARGIIGPDEFIPVAEASGLIMQLGEWVIANAASQVRAWDHGGLALAVNISARQFHHPNLCDRLLELVQSAGFDPTRIEIEITESMALADDAQSIETVRKLKRTGAAIAVDDFGTGHSSLNYLRRFDVDHIKIDRSFVAGIGAERSDETIVKAIIAMGHSLGLTVVAEGVENREQLDFLRAHGCDRAQGYLFSKPIAAAEMDTLIKQWRGTKNIN
jgi:diguanylate cyclase (GGDEF)-like protein/PAS domain S-box-containing protein